MSTRPEETPKSMRALKHWGAHVFLFALALLGPSILATHPYFEFSDWLFWQTVCGVFAALGGATRVFVDRFPKAALTSYVAGVAAQVLFVMAALVDTNRQLAAVWDEYALVGFSVALGAVSFSISAAALNQLGEAKNLRRW